MSLFNLVSICGTHVEISESMFASSETLRDAATEHNNTADQNKECYIQTGVDLQTILFIVKYYQDFTEEKRSTSWISKYIDGYVFSESEKLIAYNITNSQIAHGITLANQLGLDEVSLFFVLLSGLRHQNDIKTIEFDHPVAADSQPAPSNKHKKIKRSQSLRDSDADSDERDVK
jgi:hypothetical protein